MSKTIHLESVEHAIEAILSNSKVHPRGAGTKDLMASNPAEFTSLDCQALSGILEYEPTEFTITAKAGTRLSEIMDALAQNGQYLPFDPPFRDQGSTLGGAVASGINGSSSLRFGGLRDFILGVRFIDGLGRQVFSGGKVVKNAAGFDLPKFMVGSRGQFGLITELTFKVFPRPELQASVVYTGPIADHLRKIKLLLHSPIELDAVDIASGKLYVRFGGSEKILRSLEQRLTSLLGTPDNILRDQEEYRFWASTSEFEWALTSEKSTLLKVPCQFNDLEKIVEWATSNESTYHIAIAGQVVYLLCSADSVPKIDSAFSKMKLQYLLLRGNPVTLTTPLGTIAESMKNALDPHRKFSN